MFANIIKWILIVLGVLVLAFIGMLFKLAADSRNMEVTLGLEDGRLKACPASPNCVSSDAPPDDSHYIAPITDPEGSRWASLVARVGAMDGTVLRESTGDYIHFTFRTPVMGFIDDVEFHHRPGQGEIAVRSASRVGYGDGNTNRKRMEAIRTLLE